jgi:hypothetical protein
MEKKTPSEKIIAHFVKLFNVKDRYDDEFVEWSEVLGYNQNLNDRTDEILDSGICDDYEDPEYEAAWMAAGKMSDKEALKSFNKVKERY